MYSFARNILFKLDPERSHELSLDALGAAERLGLLKPFIANVPDKPVDVMGLRFPNPVGLAAGLDKNGDYFNALGQLGFGFLEIGTITPLAQSGNPEPRLFRLVNERAIINRMGFNNKGVEHLAENVRKRRYQGILGINIGKNKATPEENALDDYAKCMDAVYDLADYITVNISSPNTPGLRNLQFGDALNSLLAGIADKRKSLADGSGRLVPIAVKIAPDMSPDETKSVADTLVSHGMDAVIATNTTIDRQGIPYSEHKDEAGGLSGAPLTEKSTETVATLAEHLKGSLPIIGVGGIMCGHDAKAKIEAGASLVQLYSGFIYEGPALVKECVDAL